MSKAAFAIQESLSEPGGSGNEDVFGMTVRGDRVDLWIVDGATSIADEDRLGLEVSDPAWFAQAMSLALGAEAQTQDVPTIIKHAVRAVSKDYETRTHGLNVATFEKPLAALGWMRVTPQGEGSVRVQVWGLGDTRFLIGNRDGVKQFPSTKRQDIVKAKPANDEKRSRTGILMSHATGERGHRERSHTVPEHARLGFHPDSIDFAERLDLTLREPFSVLAMSDGFYRLVDEYALYDDAGLLQAAENGLRPLYAELRDYESAAEQRKDYAIKRRDDATAVYLKYDMGS